MIGTPFQQEVLRRLSELSPVYIVGGAVRDAQLGIPINDVDAVTALSLQQIEKNLSAWGYNPHVLGVHQPIVSLFRESDRVDISVFSGEIEKDALCRDFTINALYQDVQTGEIKDPLNGLHALRDRRLITCGRAEERFQEDPLRILRLVRFAVRYDLEIEQETWQAAADNLLWLQRVSVERVTEELGRILVLEEVDKGIGLLDNLEYFENFIPELARLKGLVQNRYHTKDAWEHSRNVASNTPSRLLLRLAALFHDIGKWETASRECNVWGIIKLTAEGYTIDRLKLVGKNMTKWKNKRVEVNGGRLDNYPDTIFVKRIKPTLTTHKRQFEWVPNGKRHFIQHEKESARLVKEILTRFRWAMVLPGGSKGERELHFLVGHHMLGTLSFMSELKGEVDNTKLCTKARRFAWEAGWDGQNLNVQRVHNLLDLWRADFLGGKQDAERNLNRLDRIQDEVRNACKFLTERAVLLEWSIFEEFARDKGLEAERFGQFKEQVRKQVMIDSKNRLTDHHFLEKEYRYYCSRFAASMDKGSN